MKGGNKLRKILSLILLTIIPIFLFGFVPDSGGSNLWHGTGEEDSQQVHYVYSRIKYQWGMEETGKVGLNSYPDWTFPMPNAYLAIDQKNLEIKSPGENYKRLIIKTANFNGGNYDFSNPVVKFDHEDVSEIIYKNNNGSLEIINKDTGEVIFSPYENPYKIYWVYEFSGSYDTVESLPKTENRVLGNVFFTVTGNNVVVTIWYQGMAYNLQYSMAPQTDMSIFDTKEAYYINTAGPQIFINHSDRLYLKDILSANSDEKPAFVPHTIWDLNSNELTHVKKYNAYVYLKQNTKGVMMSYFYVDEFIMDKILSATLTYYSRQHIKNWFGLQKETTPWEQEYFSYTNEDTLKYKNLTSGWVDWVPGWNLISLLIKSNVTYEMPRISNVDWNNIQPEYNVTRSEVEREIQEVYPEFNGLKSNPRYKLWAFALRGGASFNNPAGSVQTELYQNKDNKDDPKNLKVIEIVYETDGKVYTTVGSDMNLIIAIDDPIDGVEKDTAKRPWWALPLFFIAAAFVVGVINKSGGFKDPIKFIKSIITLGIGAAIIYLAYLYIFTDQLKWLLNLVFRL